MPAGSRSPSRPRGTRRGLELVLFLVVACGAATAWGPVAAATPDNPREADLPSGPAEQRSYLARQFAERIRARDLASARATANLYLERFPGDGRMTYNLACLDLQEGDTASAWDRLDLAFREGFTDLEQILADPDLAGLRADPRFAGWLLERRRELSARATEAGLALPAGAWSEELLLRPGDGTPPPSPPPEVTVRLRRDGGGLHFAARIVDPRLPAGDLSWEEGGGLQLVVACPDSQGTYESRRHFVFGYGLVDGQPVGMALARHGQPLSRRVVELDPGIRLDPDGRTASIEGSLPWTAVSPYGPPLDTILGVNVLYPARDDDGGRTWFALVPDPHADRAAAQRRRFAILSLPGGPDSPAALRGRPSSTVVGDAPLAVELVAWSPQAGQGRLELGVEDIAGRSVVAGGARAETVPLQAGANRWRREADMSALPTGPFRYRAELTLPGGETLAWQTELLRLDAGWPAETDRRIELVPSSERETLRYRLDAVTRALDSHDPRDDPAPIATTMMEIESLLARADATGTILPGSGELLVSYRNQAGELRPGSLWVPDPETLAAPRRLLVAITGRQGAESALAERLAGALPAGSGTVVLVPHARAPHPLRGDRILGDLAAAVRWGRERLGDVAILVAGVDLGGTDALYFALRREVPCAGVLVLADAEFVPWPGRSRASMMRLLAAQRPDHPFRIVALPPDAGQAGLVAGAMREAGFDVSFEEADAAAADAAALANRIAAWCLDPGGDGTASRP